MYPLPSPSNRYRSVSVVRFCELSVEEPSQAIHYLQTKLSDLVDKDDPIEREQVGGEHMAILTTCVHT